MTPVLHIFTPMDVHRFVDDVLDEHERRAFLAFLSDAPHSQDDVRAYERQNRLLVEATRATGL